MINHLYMQSHNKRRNKNQDLLRTSAPYVATALLVIVLFWGVDSIKHDGHKRQSEPGDVVRPTARGKDWTQKLSTVPSYDDKNRPDDRTDGSCPMPTGNWGHTCDRELVIEGPCNGKCMLKARCQDVKEKFKETTFEYAEGRRLEIKNVNGLLCTIEDGSPSCGVNFHGNMALKNCDGYIPRRHETMHDGLYAPPPEDETTKNKWDEPDHGMPDDDDEPEEDDYKYKKNKYNKNKYDDDDYDDPPQRNRRRKYDDDDDDFKRSSYKRPSRYEDHDEQEYKPRKRSYDDDVAPRRTARWMEDDFDSGKRNRGYDADTDSFRRPAPRTTRRYDDDDDDDNDRMLRGAPKRRPRRYDDDDEFADSPQRRGLREVDDNAW